MSIKKRIKPGKIEPSSDGTAIVVHFTTEITHLDEDGMPGHVEKCEPESREVPICKAGHGLCADDIPALAQEIVEKCKYIPDSKVKHVEQALAKILAASSEAHPHPRPDDVSGVALSMASTTRGTSLSTTIGSRTSRMAGTSRGRERRWSGSPSTKDLLRLCGLPEASINSLDDYADELYEDQLELRAAGARRLLRLCTEARNLGEVCEHSTLLGVLSRELRESGKKSTDLAVAIMGVFACLAHFSQFHAALVQHQCGEATMKVVEYESRRRAVLQKELKLSQGQLVARGSAVTAEEREKLEREEHRQRCVLERQDRVLQLCLLVLWSLAEETGVERQLVSQRLCQLLMPLLAREAEDVLATTLGFLQKLSVFEQNKDTIVASADTMARIAELVGHSSAEVVLQAMRLCYNLSFDASGREVLVTQTCLVAKLPGACQQPGVVRKVALKVLYNLTLDMALRSTIATRSGACLLLSLQLLVKCKERPVAPDTAALAINLATEEGCATIMVEVEAFPKVVLRAVQTGDVLLLKVVRHVVSHKAVCMRVLEVMRDVPCIKGDQRSDAWLHELLRLISSCLDAPRPDLLVEVVGVLSALDVASPEVAWPELCDAGLLSMMERLLVPGFVEDDALLETVILAGVLCMDQECEPLLSASQVPTLIQEVFNKKEDADMIVQLLFTLRCLLMLDEPSEVVLQDTNTLNRIMDVVQSAAQKPADPRAQAVQAYGEDLLDLVLQLATEPHSAAAASPWLGRIQAFRFELHNAEWCARLSRGNAKDSLPVPEASGGFKATGGSRASGGFKATLSRERSRGAGGWADVGGLSDREWDENAFAQSNAMERPHRSRERHNLGESVRHEGKERKRKSTRERR
mmetsp:Transcript_94970/g.245304  ORF Transcript_94970/g.245304 Transcript_94970/m.245304 type:complete len:866 (-) Transcript_94970:160-2757(-)